MVKAKIAPLDWASCYGSLCHTPFEAAPAEALASDHPGRHFESYWRGLAGAAKMPARSALQPGEIKPLLKWLMLFDVSECSREAAFSVRLHGTAAAAMMHYDFTGFDLRDFTAEENYTSRRDAILTSIHSAEPVFGRARVQAFDGPHVEIGVGLFPFVTDEGDGYHVAAVTAPVDAHLRQGL